MLSKTMDLEHLTQLPYDNTRQQFYQYENGGKIHQIEYQYFRIEGKDFILVSQVPCSHKVIADKCPQVINRV